MKYGLVYIVFFIFNLVEINMILNIIEFYVLRREGGIRWFKICEKHVMISLNTDDDSEDDDENLEQLHRAQLEQWQREERIQTLETENAE